MTVAAQRGALWLHPSLVVARFTLRSAMRRRWLAVAALLGLVLLVVDGVYTKTNTHIRDELLAQMPHRLAYDVFVSSASLSAVIIGGAGMVVAMSILRDDLGSGAGELLLTKPLPRAWYAAGKVATLALTLLGITALVALVRIGVLLLTMDDSAYLADSLLDTLAIAANAFVLGLIVLAITSWGSSLAAALVAVILLLMATTTAPLMQRVASHDIVDPEATLVTVAYDAAPRMLGGPKDYYGIRGGGGGCTFQSGRTVCTLDTTPVDTAVAGSPAMDVVAWAGYGAGTIGILLLGIRRYSGRHTD